MRSTLIAFVILSGGDCGLAHEESVQKDSMKQKRERYEQRKKAAPDRPGEEPTEPFNRDFQPGGEANPK